MQGWKIFMHSMGMVTRNLGTAIRIALVPALIGMAAVIATFLTTGLSMESFGDEQAMAQVFEKSGPTAVLAPLLLLALFMIVIELWVFVSWHRFILLEEYPAGWIPKFRPDRILAYLGKGIVLGLIATVSAVLIVFIVASIAAIIGNSNTTILMFAPLVSMLLVAFAVYRLTPILPAAAIGKPLKISEAWAATRGSGWAIVLVLILIFAVQVLIQLVATFSMMVFAPLGFAFLLLSTLVMTLLNVSVLTTMYGHYVEGRPLD